MGRVVAAFSYRYDKDLVPTLLKNISWVDDVISIDDRSNTDLWFDEGKMRKRLTELAVEAGADWILELDPDERLEKKAGDILRALTKHKYKAVFEFKLRELYEPTKYRVDGVWGNKRRRKLYPVYSGQTYKEKKVHNSGFPINKDYAVVPLDLNIYHLKMIEKENRETRADIFNEVDPNKEYQPMGYDYLKDETGMVLEEIPAGKSYLPKYEEWRMEV